MSAADQADLAPPPYLLTGALLFWGWFAGLVWLAAVLALLAELPGWRGWRWELEPKERQRVADLCTVLIALAGVWLFLNQPRLGAALITLIRWLPALIFPLLAVQLYGRHRGLEMAVLFLSLRGGRPGGDQIVDLRWGFLLLCIVSASMVDPDDGLFYPALALLAGWALWGLRPVGAARRWALLLVLALPLGFALAGGLRLAHDEAEILIMRWVEYWLGPAQDPYRTTTAIGEVGELKGAQAIRLRVYPDHRLLEPLLLRTASYDRYIETSWFGGGATFQPLPGGDNGWTLAEPPGDGAGRHARILLNRRRPEGLLPAPGGTFALKGLAKTELLRNDFGTIRFEVGGGPALSKYRVRFGPAGGPYADPAAADAIDLRLPRAETEALTTVVHRLGLADLPPRAAIDRLERWFNDDFRYSLVLPRIPVAQTPLGYFLLEHRAGHCEYFATAAALVLRAAGIPTRYARGWSVQEYSDLEDAYLVRDRHAHAWVMVWIDGAWHDFDPTPPDWEALEQADRPWWGQARDLLAWLRFELSGAGEDKRGDRTWLLLPLAGLVLLLAWRITRRARRGFREHDGDALAAELITRLAPIEAALAERGLGRRPAESLKEWAQRLERDGEPAGTDLLELIALYYRDRFDPAGLDARQRRRLTDLIDSGLQRWA